MADVQGDANRSMKREHSASDSELDVPLEAKPPVKIQRTEAPQIQYRHSTAYFFDDGNIVLLTADNMKFRVHRGVLSMHSSYFRNLFPTLPNDDGKELEDCTILRVGEDALTVRWLLDVMYNAGKCVLKMHDNITIVQLGYILRAGAKYEVQLLTNAALRRFRYLFPTTDLGQWKPFGECKKTARITEDDAESDLQRLTELTVLLVLVRDFPELRRILPLVLYECCQLPIAVLSKPGGQSTWPNLGPLAPDYQSTCLKAIPKLGQRRLEVLSAFTLPSASRRYYSHGKGCCDLAMLKVTHDALLDEHFTASPCPLEDLGPWCALQPSLKNFGTILGQFSMFLNGTPP
ncbi:hypothetical protein BDY19DRAFT_133032 [Irpex rosettiformis]|uniref:Uncharacterized protein n=1 Tax=Irpex rosettiformis TaxID=378272 RepID=A0ACB8U4J9_9APHY|nr:hypothetical protein BDY19DRAFT_133032 [Irpex rosettiformis]